MGTNNHIAELGLRIRVARYYPDDLWFSGQGLEGVGGIAARRTRKEAQQRGGDCAPDSR